MPKTDNELLVIYTVTCDRYHRFDIVASGDYYSIPCPRCRSTAKIYFEAEQPVSKFKCLEGLADETGSN
jgi:phage FluMu protein Com